MMELEFCRRRRVAGWLSLRTFQSRPVRSAPRYGKEVKLQVRKTHQTRFPHHGEKPFLKKENMLTIEEPCGLPLVGPELLCVGAGQNLLTESGKPFTQNA